MKIKNLIRINQFLQQEQTKIKPYSVTQMKNLQSQLNVLGFETGEPDGIWGPKSRDAIRSFQLKYQLIADGYPNKEVFSTITFVQSKNKAITPNINQEG